MTMRIDKNERVPELVAQMQKYFPKSRLKKERGLAPTNALVA